MEGCRGQLPTYHHSTDTNRPDWVRPGTLLTAFVDLRLLSQNRLSNTVRSAVPSVPGVLIHEKAAEPPPHPSYWSNLSIGIINGPGVSSVTIKKKGDVSYTSFQWS